MAFNTKPFGAAYYDMKLDGTALVNVPTTGADVGIGIGSGVSAETALQVSGTFPTSGTNTLLIKTDGNVPSGTTTTARMFSTGAGTAAASFTLGGLQHFTAVQGSFGAGSAVTSQYGFLADSSLTGATNNYAFFADLASGAGRFNFYAGGDAVNYFAGNVGINTTTPSEKLEVNGSIKTAAPAGGTAAAWRLGTVATVSPTSPNRTIEVEIGGTIYYLHAKTTND